MRYTIDIVVLETSGHVSHGWNSKSLVFLQRSASRGTLRFNGGTRRLPSENTFTGSEGVLSSFGRFLSQAWFWIRVSYKYEYTLFIDFIIYVIFFLLFYYKYVLHNTTIIILYKRLIHELRLTKWFNTLH